MHYNVGTGQGPAQTVDTVEEHCCLKSSAAALRFAFTGIKGVDQIRKKKQKPTCCQTEGPRRREHLKYLLCVCRSVCRGGL